MSEDRDHSKVTGFTFFRSWWEALKKCDKGIRTEVMDCMCGYAFDGVWNIENISPMAEMFLVSNRPTLENTVKKSLSGKIGGDKKSANLAKEKKGDKRNETCYSSKNESASVGNGEEKRRVEENGMDKERNGSPLLSAESSSDLDTRSICQNFNTICYKLEPLQSMSEKQKANTEIFLETYGMAKMSELFHLVGNSDFLCGSKEFKADYDWIIKLENAEKIFSGKYGNNEKKSTPSGGSAFIQYAEEQWNLTSQSKGNPDGINTIQPQAP